MSITLSGNVCVFIVGLLLAMWQNNSSRDAVDAAFPALNTTSKRIDIMPAPKLSEVPFRGKSLIGKKFARLKVKSFHSFFRPSSHRGYFREALWACECVCGKTLPVRSYSLTSGHTKSCGCYAKEAAANAHLTHRYSRHRSGKKPHTLFTTWAGMIQRCTNPCSVGYQYYGGRGIIVCKRWRKFSGFLRDMGKTWRPGLTLERQSTEGHYYPSNCVWATMKEQQSNKSCNRFETFNGITLTHSEWAERLGGSSSLVRVRLERLGWSIEEALTLKPLKKGERIK